MKYLIAILFFVIIGSIGYRLIFINNQNKSMSDNNQQILQKVLDIKELEQYFHAELELGKKAAILKNPVTQNQPQLFKFGQPVVYVETEKLDKNKDYLVFEKLDISNDSALVEFSYPQEGIFGRAQLAKEGNIWTVVKHEIMER